MHEIKRIENFRSGTYHSPRCGGKVTLNFNGGELDNAECCGLVFSTEHTVVDLVIYDLTDKEDQK